nr:MarR family transcriptional regulator [Microbacterium bovistercoris]
MVDPRVIDPKQELVEYGSLTEAEIAQVVRVLTGIRRWREAEQQLSLSSRDRMKLNETDMQALRFLVVAKNDGRLVTPGALAEYLGISSASTTKLLDRLAAAGHIERAAHPTDRRALTIRITQQTHEQVRDTVGRTHARRFEVAARMSPAERDTVIRFLDDLSQTAEAGVTAGESESSR